MRGMSRRRQDRGGRLSRMPGQMALPSHPASAAAVAAAACHRTAESEFHPALALLRGRIPLPVSCIPSESLNRPPNQTCWALRMRSLWQADWPISTLGRCPIRTRTLTLTSAVLALLLAASAPTRQRFKRQQRRQSQPCQLAAAAAQPRILPGFLPLPRQRPRLPPHRATDHLLPAVTAASRSSICSSCGKCCQRIGYDAYR